MKKTSSGTEKAEKLTRTNSKTEQTPEKKPVRTATKKAAPVKTATKTKKMPTAAKVKREKAKKAKAEKKLELKQKRLERLAALKEKVNARREKRRERREQLKHESKEARAERIAQARRAKIEAREQKRKAEAAERQAKREHRLKVRAEKRADRKERRHAPGFGGWLAAVISLGVVTLALSSALTYGWIIYNNVQSDVASMHVQSLYELNSIVDNLDANLTKARVASSREEQIKLFTDVAIQSEMAETILERMPLDGSFTQSMTSLVNKMGDEAIDIVNTAAENRPLSESQRAAVEYMYNSNLQLKEALNALTGTMNEKEMLKAMRSKKDTALSRSFGDMKNNVLETPKEINDGPFAENTKRTNARGIESLEEINATNAEELAKKYFADYTVKSVRCTGETVAKQLACYNLVLDTEQGEMFAQLTKKGGRVVMFDSFKDCSSHNFSVERCIDIAGEFLQKSGFKDMKAVWTSENGTTCNLNFVYERDGVIFYPDMVKVKVCEERGIVTGLEGLAYCLNHAEREVPSAKVSSNEAQNVLFDGLDIQGSRLTVIPLNGNERLAYEFYGSYDGHEYYVYVDALTGREIQLFTVVGTKQGKALM